MKARPAGHEHEVFCFCFSSLSGAMFAAARSGQGRAVFGAAKRAFYREDRGDRIDRGGKDLVSSLCKGGQRVNHDQ